MKIIPVPAFNDNYIWMIINEEERSALCIDPGDAQPVIHFLDTENLRLEAILLTHHHNDHTGGVQELHSRNAVSVYGPQDSRIPFVSEICQEGDEIIKSSCKLKVLSTPGHTVSHISFYEPHYGWLFCGDTLFSAGCGRVFDGTMEELHASLQKMKALPDTTEIYCGHEYTRRNLRFAAIVEADNMAIRRHAHQLLEKENQCSLPSNIALEKQINPFFRTEEPAVQDYAKSRGCQEMDSLSVFSQLRRDKDIFY